MLKTPVAARRLGVTYHRLMGLLRFQKIAPPARDSSGDYVWTEEDLSRAAAALCNKPELATASDGSQAKPVA